jgi:hypothetical protein
LPNLGPDQLFMGEGDGVWRNDTDELVGLRFHRTTGSVAADVDGTFVSRSDLLPQAAHDGYTYACGLHDLDADGGLDLYFVNDFGSRIVSNRAYRSTTEGSTWNFEDVSEETGLDLELFGMGLAVGDLNGDTLPDLLITSWDDLALLESAADGTWYESSASRGLSVDVGVSNIGWGVELEDLDNDGDLNALIAYGYLGGTTRWGS